MHENSSHSNAHVDDTEAEIHRLSSRIVPNWPMCSTYLSEVHLVQIRFMYSYHNYFSIQNFNNIFIYIELHFQAI